MFLNYIQKIGDTLRPILLPSFLVLLAFFGARYFLAQLGNDRNEFAERLKEIQAIHDKELGAILSAQAAERERHEQNLHQLQLDLNAAVAKHEEKLRELEHQKEIEAKRLFEKYKSDPVGLAQELSRVSGIPVYSPEVKK